MPGILGPTASYRQAPVEIPAWYTGSDQLLVGQLVSFDHDSTNTGHPFFGSGDPARSSSGMASAQRQTESRRVLVEKPSFGNLLTRDSFAGVVSAAYKPLDVSSSNAGYEIRIVPAWALAPTVDVYTDENVAVGDWLGPIPDSHNCGRGVVYPCFQAIEAQDRSGTAGLVRCQFHGKVSWNRIEPDKMSFFHDPFRATLLDKVVANVATSAVGAYLLNGTTATAEQAAEDAPVGTGIGELTLRGTTTTIAQIQQAGAQWLPSVGRSLFCRQRVKIDDVSDEDWFWGLNLPPTHSAGVLTAVAAVTSAGTVPAGTDYIGFFFDATAANALIASSRKASGTAVASTTGVGLVNDTYIDLAFIVQSKSTAVNVARFYVNGTLTNTVTAAATNVNIPNTVALAWAMSGITGGCIGTIDHLTIAQNH